MNSSSIKIQHYFFLFILIASAWLMFSVFRPFLNPLIIAGSLAIVFYPFFKRINNRLGNMPNTASIITVVAVLILVITPLLIIGSLLFGEVRSLYVSIVTHGGSVGAFDWVVNFIENQLRIFMPEIRIDIAYYTEQFLRWIFMHLDTFFSSFIGIMIDGLVMIAALFFLLRDGKKLYEELLIISPLDQKYDESIFSKIISAVNSVVKGSLVISLVQGIFAAIGFAITGVPNPVLWGVTTMFASLIPGFGTALVTVPCIIFLFFTAPLWQAIVLAIWAFVGVGLIDNFLTPSILKRGMSIHPFIILISVLGGLSFFGPVGFIVGPIILAFFFALLEIYPLIIKSEQ